MSCERRGHDVSHAARDPGVFDDRAVCSYARAIGADGRRSIRWLLLAAFLCALATAAPASATISADWQSFTVAPIVGSPLVAAGSDGDLYALFSLNQLRRYDPGTDSWAMMPSLPERTNASLASIPGGDVYLVGGGQNGTMLQTNDAFDPSTQTWTVRADMPIGLHSPAVAGAGGRLYVFGGETASSPSCGVSQQCFPDATLIYDPATDSWSSAAAPPISPIYMTGAVALADGWIYLPGMGEAYQPATDTWKLTALPPFAQSFTFSATADGHIVALSYDQVTTLVTVSVYRPATDTWTHGTAQSVPLNSSAASALVGGRIYVVGVSGQGNRENRAFLDITPPMGSFQIDGGAATTDTPAVSVTSTAADSSGIDAIRLSNTATTAGGILAAGTTFPYPGPVTWQLDGAGDGTKTVWAQWRDPFGNWSVPVAESITLDRPPVVTQVPSPTLPATGTITGTSASVTLTWAASDLTPILSYDLFQSTDGGAEVSVFDGDATSAKRHLSFGHTYGYRVGATDSTNQTGTATAPSFSLHLAQQSAAALSGAWTTNTGSTYAGGSDVSATQAGAAATFTFTGRAVSLVGVTGPTHGKLRVYVDGALVKTIDTYHSTVVTRRVLFARGWATGGTHTLAVVCAGTSGRPRIDVDGFVTIQ